MAIKAYMGNNIISRLRGDVLIPKDYKNLNKLEKIERHKEIGKVFFKLGTLAFGGPAAHIAMMDDEIIEKRNWISREKFMDLIGATNLIPGPNSTEMAIHLGFERGGGLGLLIGGIAFIFPAMAITLFFAYLYVRFGDIPQVGSILYGMKPVIIVIILNALFRLGKSVIKSKFYFILGIFIVGIYLLGIGEIPLLLLSGIFITLIKNRNRIKEKFFAVSPLSLMAIFLIFLKIGSVLYGSGYVLLAFLEAEFVDKLGILTNQQLVDAIAVGQFTPGPVFTTITFIGYLLKGFPGAIVATIGVFIPSFSLVWLLNPIIPKLRNSAWLSGILDGVNLGALALMAVVTVKLGITSLIDPISIFIFIISLFTIIKIKINSPWIILLGGIIGFLSNLVM